MNTAGVPAGGIEKSDPTTPRRRFPRLRAALTDVRSWIHRHPRVRAPYRVLVALAGATVMVTGLILVPLPGPGWLIVFVGVAVLGTEFPAAHRLTELVRRQARRVLQWWRARQARQATGAGRSSAA
jgi:uncharacterized protein (TIGR02611 family)